MWSRSYSDRSSGKGHTPRPIRVKRQPKAERHLGHGVCGIRSWARQPEHDRFSEYNIAVAVVSEHLFDSIDPPTVERSEPVFKTGPSRAHSPHTRCSLLLPDSAMAISQDIPHDPNARVWLITGTSSGMGRALVKSALGRSDKVIATARVLEQIQDLRSLADPSRLYLMQLDITDAQDVISSKVNEAIDVWGRIDVLVNNAGTGVKMILEEGGYVSCFSRLLWITLRRPFLCSVEGIIRQFKTNVFGVMAVTYAVLPHMRRRLSGTIVITGSRSAFANEFPVRISLVPTYL